MTQTQTMIRMICTALIAVLAFTASAQAGDIFKKRGWDHAVNGYDVVAYHSVSDAVKGDEAFSTEYLGETWLFSSQENLDTFKADPDAYRPAYGGYCAWAMAQGKKAPGAPTVWYIENGTLYLNVSNGIQKKWLKDLAGFITRADAQWPGARG